MKRRYPALRILFVFNTLVAVCIFGGSFVIARVLSRMLGEPTNLAVIGVGFLMALGIIAGNESLKVLLDIEENTRRSAERLPPG